MAKFGMKSAAHKGAAELAAALARRAGTQHERSVAGESLMGQHKHHSDKAERMSSVMEGREGRDFGSSVARKKKKVGGLSNREKTKKKSLPIAARQSQVRSGALPRGRWRAFACLPARAEGREAVRPPDWLLLLSGGHGGSQVRSRMMKKTAISRKAKDKAQRGRKAWKK